MPDVPVERLPLNAPWNLEATPEVLDELMVQVVDSENTPRQFQNLSPGQPHPNQDKYPGYLFVGASPLSHSRTQQFWSTPAYQNQDLYNYDLDYVQDSRAHELFVRRYLVLRTAYNSFTTGTSGQLSGVWQIRVGVSGSGYDPESPPTVTVAGDGSGCTATALVGKNGEVYFIRITAEGTGFTTAPTVTIAPPTAGVQATATAFIQDQSCVLIKQNARELPVDDKRYSLFLLVTRVYQTFPGPEIIEWRHIPKLGIYAQIIKQLILNTDIPADPNDSVLPEGRTVEYQELTAVYGVMITTQLPVEGFVWESDEVTNDYIYEGTEDYRFPDQIPVQPIINLLVAGNAAGVAFDFALQCKIEEGYSGPCRAIFKERYTYDPTDAAFIAGLPAVTQVFPDAHTILTGIIFLPAGGTSPPRVKYLTWPISSALHPAFNYSSAPVIVNGNIPLPPQAGTFIKGNVAATEPSGFEPGDSILRVSSPQRVGIGNLWVVYIVEIFYPED